VFADQCSLLKQYVYWPSVEAVNEWSPLLTDRSWIWYALVGFWIYVLIVSRGAFFRLGTGSYPEVDVEVPATAKLPVTHLERDRHLVVRM